MAGCQIQIRIQKLARDAIAANYSQLFKLMEVSTVETTFLASLRLLLGTIPTEKDLQHWRTIKLSEYS